LVIEIDGGIHDDPGVAEYDKERTLFLEAVNFKVIRFTNRQVLEEPEVVVKEIGAFLKNSIRPCFVKERGGGR
jgi:very-short-patch-repair endonuclease